jgi:hypothetical protein
MAMANMLCTAKVYNAFCRECKAVGFSSYSTAVDSAFAIAMADPPHGSDQAPIPVMPSHDTSSHSTPTHNTLVHTNDPAYNIISDIWIDGHRQEYPRLRPFSDYALEEAILAVDFGELDVPEMFTFVLSPGHVDLS